MRVRQLFKAVRDPVLSGMELRTALKSPPHAKKLRAIIGFACVGEQAKALRYLFPHEKVYFLKEAKEGRVLEWLNRV